MIQLEINGLKSEIHEDNEIHGKLPYMLNFERNSIRHAHYYHANFLLALDD
jgi:hypothetical protein